MTLYSEMCDTCGGDGPAFLHLPECEQCGGLVCPACAEPNTHRPSTDETIRDRVVCRACYHNTAPLVGAF